jgi:hypothetical protein
VKRKDPRVDAYIARAAPFARPVLAHLRSVVREAVPEAEETIKWGMPHWVHHGILCCIAGFKGHCALHLRRGEELLGKAADGGAMGQFGRITALSDLPSKAALVKLLREAAALNEAGKKAPRAARKPARPAPRVPGPRRGFEGKRGGRRHLRGVQPVEAARLRGVDPGGEGEGHPRRPDRDRDRLDGRGEEQELEVRGVLRVSPGLAASGRPGPASGRCRCQTSSR